MSLSQDELGKIKFMCRRGLKELDMLLPVFIKEHLLNLNKDELDAFSNILKLDDHDLLANILTPPNEASKCVLRVYDKLRKKSQKRS